MGLSSKQVTSDVLDWSQTLLQGQVLEPPKPVVLRRQQQQNQQQSEPLKCPRCDSTNTKFCYYNNYNKSQPRHFCKACKRHWTKGGTLRNVPVGGGRKNKRPKTSKPTTNNNTNVTDKATTSGTSTTASTTNMIMNGVNSQMTVQAQQQKQNLSMATLGYQAMIGALPTSGFQQNCIGKNTFNGTNNNSVFMGSSFSHQGINFNFQSLASSCFDANPGSTSVQSSGFCDYMSSEAMEDSTITTIFPTSTSSVPDHQQQEWQVPNGIDHMTSYWNWDDMDSLVSSTDLNIAWDGSEIKP